MTASCMTCIYSQLTKEQYPCSECYYDNNGNPSKHEPVVEAPDINVGNMDTTTHDSIPAETGENDEDRTSGDCISRQQAIDALRKMQTYKLFAGDDMLLIDQAEAQTKLMMLPSAQPERIKGHWIEIALSNHTYKCSVCGRLLTNITDGKNKVAKNYPYCHCGADMRGGENDGCSQVFEREESDV